MTHFGLSTFGDVTFDADGNLQHMHDVLREIVEQAISAEERGIQSIGLGEHHRDDFAISAPDVVLAAIAGKTKTIKLGTAVTVLSTDDPVRVVQRFSTLDAVSNGRAEITLGRGSFSESYPLFGHDMADYDLLFEERIDLFTKLLPGSPVTWSGQTRSPIQDTIVYPPLAPKGLPVWVGVGGSPQSVVRVVKYDLNLMLAIIGGDPARFRPFVDLYLDACQKLGKTPHPIGVHSPGFIADTDEEAREKQWPHYQTMFGRIGRERGWPPATKEQFMNEVDHGAQFVGSPETVAHKIAKTVKTLGLGRFDLKYSNGPMPHKDLLHCIKLYGDVVIPRVQELLSEPSR